jgi:hypothetical protein
MEQEAGAPGGGGAGPLRAGAYALWRPSSLAWSCRVQWLDPLGRAAWRQPERRGAGAAVACACASHINHNLTTSSASTASVRRGGGEFLSQK